MDDLTAQSIEGFLNETAKRTPTPGGGSVTGLTGALACALAHMVAAFSVRKSTDSETRARVEEAARRIRTADQLLRALITQDAEAYASMTEAAKTAENSDDARARYAEAVMAAVAVPMEMAAVISRALSTMNDLKGVANRHLLSDLGIAAVLGEATARAARYTVRINLGQISSAEQRATITKSIDEIVEHCAECRESIEAFVGGLLEQGQGVNR